MTETTTLPATRDVESAEIPVRHVVPAVDVLVRPGAWRLQVDLPGVRVEDLALDLDQSVLTLQAARRDRPGLGWKRRVRLPEAVDLEGVDARLRHGVLTVDLPAREADRARRIPVSIG